MVKPFFRGSPKKWLPDSRMAKMVTTGRLLMHLQRTPEMSRQWGPPHILCVGISKIRIFLGDRRVASLLAMTISLGNLGTVDFGYFYYYK